MLRWAACATYVVQYFDVICDLKYYWKDAWQLTWNLFLNRSPVAQAIELYHLWQNPSHFMQTNILYWPTPVPFLKCGFLFTLINLHLHAVSPVPRFCHWLYNICGRNTSQTLQCTLYPHKSYIKKKQNRIKTVIKFLLKQCFWFHSPNGLHVKVRGIKQQ